MSEAEHDNLLKENQELKEENERLRSKLREYGISPDIPSAMSQAEKLAVYRNCFKGRTAPYARKVWSNKTNRHYWSPVCNARFTQRCPYYGKKMHCAQCEHPEFPELTDEVLIRHFSKDANECFYGIYPLLDDNTCWFLAIDFDDDQWFPDMLSVYQTAIKHQFYPVMERSSSGHGGHLWFFFQQNIPAAEARQMGDALLQEAMETNRNLSFASLDRMFPNQDYLPYHGIGNLIALPLQRECYKNGNTAFINELGQKIKDPFAFLAGVQKIPYQMIRQFLAAGMEEDYFYDSDQLTLSLNTGSGYCKDLYGYISDTVAISMKGMNTLTLRSLIRAASMWNPEYFELQRQHRPIYLQTTPRVLSFYERDDQYLYLPRGVEEKLSRILPETNFHLEDRRCEGYPLKVQFNGQLRTDQQDAADRLLCHDMGVLQAVPGFGKTVISTYLIAKLGVSTLIVVDGQTLQAQWEERLMQFLGIEKVRSKKKRTICIYNGSSKVLNHQIDIVSPKALANAENIDELLQGYGLVIVDECHRAAADSFVTVLRHCNAKHIYGLSATPHRDDGKDKIIYLYCGRIRYIVSSLQARKTHTFQQVLIPRYTASAVQENTGYMDMMDHLMNDEARNYQIFKDVMQEYRADGKIIILTERVAHIETLTRMLEMACDHVYHLDGKMSAKEKKRIIDEVRSLLPEQNYILIATSTLLGTGFDLPSLKTMFLAMPISSANRLTQYTGRIHRPYEGKDVVKVYDYLDIRIPMAASMYQKRLKQYLKDGYVVQEEKNETAVDKVFFEADSYQRPLLEDIRNASGSIVFHTTYAEINRIKEYYAVLQERIQKGVKVVFEVSPKIPDNIIANMTGMGAEAVQNTSTGHFIFIDERYSWISNQDFLQKGSASRFCTRIDDAGLVSEFLYSLQKAKPAKEEGIFAGK